MTDMGKAQHQRNINMSNIFDIFIMPNVDVELR
jgi:hypothetical protein